MRFTRSIIAAAAICATATAIAADPGVTDSSILLGQSAALKGSAQALGEGMQTGMQVYFDAKNAQGGVNGRTIELRSINDGYEPDKAAKATEMLIDRAGVFAMIGGVGTPTAKAIVPICEANEVPFVGPFTGAEFLRNPHKPWVVNVRGSYYQEMERLAALLVDQTGLTKIACFYQADGYGQAGLTGIKNALERRGMELVGEGTYERNTIAIAGGLASVKASNPEAVIMVGAYKACAAFIKAAKADPAFANTTFCNISFVGTKALGEALGADADGVIVSQCVPFPWDTSVPVVQEYTEAMKSAGKESEIGFVTLEGYIVAKTFCDALSNISGEPTRQGLIDAFASVGTFDFGGVKLTYGATDNQGSDDIWLTVFDGTSPRPLDVQAFAAVAGN